MKLEKNDLVILAGRTLSWAAEKECLKQGPDDHQHFSVEAWCDYFDHSPYIFRKVKITMVELGIPISLRPTFGHYISDRPVDSMSTIEVALKNIVTRLETVAALADGARKSKHSNELLQRLSAVVDDLNLNLNPNGKLTVDTGILLAPPAQLQ